MVKRLALRMQAKGRVYLGTVMVKRIQTLVWWVRDHQKRGLPVSAADFTVQAMNEAAEMKGLKHDMAEMEPSVSDLGKFNLTTMMHTKTLSLTYWLSPMELSVNRSITLFAQMQCQKPLQQQKRNVCTSSHLPATPFSWIIRLFIGNLKPS
jgi:hypothetical protein